LIFAESEVSMSTPYQLLLRRTIAVVATAMALGATAEAQAQGKVKLSGAQGNECSYSSMSITPDGSVTVVCSGTSTPPPPPVDNSIPGTFSMSSAAMNATANTTPQVPVVRTGGGLAFTVYYWFTGSGCKQTTVGALNFATGVMTAYLPAPVGAADTTCTVNLGQPAAPAALGSQKTTTITVVAGSTTPPPVSGCPAGFVPPADMSGMTLTGMGQPLIAMQKSGQVLSIPLPNLGGLATGQVTFGESSTAATPQPVTLEISINKCPGLIDTSSTSCNLKSTMSSYNSITWFAKAYSIITDAASADKKGYCWAGDSSQYYVNARWTYQSCPFGAQACGFAVQYNQGPF
jgi:hypothetical protein